MSLLSRNARVAGLLYLSLLVATLRLVYIPNTLFVTGNPTATANNIATHETLFRLGIAGDLFTGTMVIFVTLALYRLFKSVDEDLARLVVILGSLVVSPIYFVNTLNDMGALLFARSADFLSAFSRPECDAFVMFFLRLHHHGVVVNEIFWGLWLFPFGVLVYRSHFLPRILGVWLIINGFAYLAASCAGLVLPQYEEMVSNSVFPVMLGEVAMMLWLVIAGAKPQKLYAAGSSSPAA